MTTALVNYQEGMSRERFRQEAALRILDRIMEAVGDKIAARFEATSVQGLSKALAQFEECRGRVIGAVVEALADSVTNVVGADEIPGERE